MVKIVKIKKNELVYELDDVLKVLAKMDNKDIIFDFLNDIMTEKELLELARRFEVAKLLEQGISYSRIQKKTQMSSTTIAKISKSLNSDNLGYKSALNLI